MRQRFGIHQSQAATRPGNGRRWILAAATLTVAGGLCSQAAAATVAKPFDAWQEPQIKETMTIDEAKAIATERTRPQTEWKGPTSGPQATKDAITVVYVSADESYVSFVNWGRGVEEAAKALGWKTVILNGKGTITGTLQAMQQAVSLNPAAIVTSADASALQEPIKQAVAQNIPVIGIHATAYPGPDPKLNLFTNISSNPAEIGETQAAYVIAQSDGKAKLLHFRTSDGKEVDFVLERPDGSVFGIEIKKSESVNIQDFKGIKTLAELTEHEFIGGVVLYAGKEVVPFGKNLWAVPFHILWQ